MKKNIFIFLIISFSNLNIGAQPNGGFENWHTEYGYQVPDDWQTFNFLSITFPPNPISVIKVTGIDKHSGNYALKLKTVFIHTNPAPGVIDDTIGGFFTGKIAISPPTVTYGFPFTGRPEKLEFWHKYIPVGMDEGGVAIILKKWNGSGVDTVATGKLVFTETATYVKLQVELDYFLTAIPDSAIIAFASSRKDNMARVGSTLYVDDVAFTGWVGIDEYSRYPGKVKLYPNPARDNVTIITEIEEAENIKITDITGKIICEEKIQNYKVNINTGFFAESIYFYEISDKKQQVIAKGKFNVIQ